jgi:hypothetical protein
MFKNPIIEILAARKNGTPWLDVFKQHIIRKNYEFWLKRIKTINCGKAYLSIRTWTEKPYRNLQHELTRLEDFEVVIQKYECITEKRLVKK